VVILNEREESRSSYIVVIQEIASSLRFLAMTAVVDFHRS